MGAELQYHSTDMLQVEFYCMRWNAVDAGWLHNVRMQNVQKENRSGCTKFRGGARSL